MFNILVEGEKIYMIIEEKSFEERLDYWCAEVKKEIQKQLPCGWLQAEFVAQAINLREMLSEPYAWHTQPEEWGDIAIGYWEDYKSKIHMD